MNATLAAPFTGAEATVAAAEWMGRTAVTKHRIPKGYRLPMLDAALRSQRTKAEAHLLSTARTAGVRVPIVYDCHEAEALLVLERIDGPALRDVLPEATEEMAAGHLRTLGIMTARLHAAGLTHGDLTTSNVLVDGSLVLIDFGLGAFTQEWEPRGVDLHLVEEALEATDDRAAHLFEAFLQGYATVPELAPAVRRLEAIRERGRYR